ncbi:MAG: hypothetical protein HKN07_05125 [Acidimicrobiia bacterium]|nr:hypothetical protein [Acidimicrobiia bacterium]NNF63623.1 hypothetical protein [Acidimicrobiia bacterium]
MADDLEDFESPGETEPPGNLEESPKKGAPPIRRDPVSTLNVGMLVYIGVNTLIGVPLTLAPAGLYDFVGVASDVASELNGLRWLGAMMLAWAVSAILILARPVGRAFFVTAGSLQLTLGAAAFVYSWSLGEELGDTWFQIVMTIILVGSAAVLWWARLKARNVLAGKVD